MPALQKGAFRMANVPDQVRSEAPRAKARGITPTPPVKDAIHTGSKERVHPA
jgi:hypothetical protein